MKDLWIGIVHKELIPFFHADDEDYLKDENRVVRDFQYLLNTAKQLSLMNRWFSDLVKKYVILPDDKEANLDLESKKKLLELFEHQQKTHEYVDEFFVEFVYPSLFDFSFIDPKDYSTILTDINNTYWEFVDKFRDSVDYDIDGFLYLVWEKFKDKNLYHTDAYLNFKEFETKLS